MARRSSKTSADTRQQILQAALRQFAHSGYAGASVQHIVDAAQVTKPVLYYYFGSKEGLYTALIEWASDERLRLTQAAAARGRSLADKLTEVVVASFEFVLANRELTRLSIGTAFAALGEVPNQSHCLARGRRVFDFMQDLVETGRRDGAMRTEYSSEDLTLGIYGVMHFQIMLHLVMPERPLDRPLANRIVSLYLSGAVKKKK